MIENRNSMIDTETDGPHGIVFDAASDTCTFFIRTLFKEFKEAVNTFISELESGTADLSKVENALANRPEPV